VGDHLVGSGVGVERVEHSGEHAGVGSEFSSLGVISNSYSEHLDCFLLCDF